MAKTDEDTIMRDFDLNPYSVDEQRVADYLAKLMPDVGTGEDPIGFLIASHATIVEDRRAAMTRPAQRSGTGQAPPNLPPTSAEGAFTGRTASLFERMSAIASGARPGKPKNKD